MKQLNILLDPYIFNTQSIGGISRYYAEVYSRLNAMSNISVILPINNPTNVNTYIRNSNLLNFEWEQISISSFDLFIPTYYSTYFLDRINAPFVLTIYDMAHETYPDQFHPLDFTIKNKRKLVSQAARVIAISENTKSDVVRMLGVPESSIDVIPLATDIQFDPKLKLSLSVPEKFILYVGARNTYKNFLFFLRGVQPLVKESSDLSVICAGGGTFSKLEMRNIELLGLTKNIFQMNVTDGMLASLYSKTQAFVYPSMYEGFGIPVLEAFTCGAAALLSNRSSLPEIGGDAALYFDPEDVESLRLKLRNVLYNKDLKMELILKGFARAKLFSWERTAEKTIETYRKVVQKAIH